MGSLPPGRSAVDPYRAATHNKGIMNGVDPVVVATGNDSRAIEAGAHAYAARSGRYTSPHTWGQDEKGDLVGSLEIPMAVGIIGGATRVHPVARASSEIDGCDDCCRIGRGHRIGRIGTKPGGLACTCHGGHPTRPHGFARPPGGDRSWCIGEQIEKVAAQLADGENCAH